MKEKKLFSILKKYGLCKKLGIKDSDLHAQKIQLLLPISVHVCQLWKIFMP